MILGYKNLTITTGVEFTFTTFPDKQDSLFQKQIDKDYFADFTENLALDRAFLYKPLKVYLLGDYDACYITFINNFKFSHRIFSPRTDEKIIFKPYASQSYSGFVLNEDNELNDLINKVHNKPIVGIINLKLNNGFLLGNGINYFEYSYHKLIDLLGDKPFFISQTFAWFDFSLVVFLDHPDELSRMLNEIRSLEMGDIKSNEIIDNSLFASIVDNKDSIKNFSIFSDLHSYLGFNCRLVEEEDDTEFVKQFYTTATWNNIEAEIEWLIKPGHEHHLNELLKQTENLKNKFEFSKTKMSLGKYDLIICQKTNDITASLSLIRYIYSTINCPLFDHIRRVRTKVYLNSTFEAKNSRKCFTWDNTLSNLAFDQSVHSNIDNRLKALKISRQVRLKIAKIFISYDNGIQDPIQFPYFLDFTLFVNKLKKIIDREYEDLEIKSVPIKDIETVLVEYIRIFQEGYYIRFLNGYQFENITDFNLDFNSSIPQLLSSYNTLLNEYGNLFYEKVNHGQLIQLNNIDTVSNYATINYSIHHLTSPEFVFSTISKEILNKLKDDYILYKEKLIEIENSFPSFLKETNETYLDDLDEHGLFDVDYFVIDAIRFIATYQFNFKLFNYWFWSYNYQNPSLFETGGMINEDHLRKEMLRIIMIANYFEADLELLKNPSPELFTLWDRHFYKLNTISKIIINYLNDHGISTIINSVVIDLFKRITSVDNPDELLIDKDTLNNMYKDKEIRENMFKRVFLSTQKNQSIKDLFKYIYSTLNNHYEKNQQKINLLRRDWNKGTVLFNHSKLYENIFYAIDPTGNIYFYNSLKMDEYFKQNALSIINIINFSLIQKKAFVENLLK